MTRPPLAQMWRDYFDNDRLRDTARKYAVIREARCTRPGRHLMVYVLASQHGPWVAYRPAGYGDRARDVWAQAWLDELPGYVDATCHCGQSRRVELANNGAVR